jgi:hypothetical protein
MNILNKGFTIFYASLVGSLALTVGIAIFELTIRELDLSQVATQSQFAIYAADVGAECAMYWDSKCPTTGGPAYCSQSGGSVFATSTSGAGVPDNSNVTCNSTDITNATSLWSTAGPPAPNNDAATTTFTVSFATQNRPYCARVTVAKSGNPSRTTVISRGYNTCDISSKLQLERSLRLDF